MRVYVWEQETPPDGSACCVAVAVDGRKMVTSVPLLYPSLPDFPPRQLTSEQAERMALSHIKVFVNIPDEWPVEIIREAPPEKIEDWE